MMGDSLIVDPLNDSAIYLFPSQFIYIYLSLMGFVRIASNLQGDIL